jgi:Protein of unknown function (DUF1572)
MLKESFREIFDRDLNKLREEINLYKNEKNIWVIDKEIKNSAGTLCLHLCGNLRYFIGFVLGSFEYKRDRDAEFSLRNVPKHELLGNIDDTIKVVNETMKKIDEEDIAKKYPMIVLKAEHTTEFFLIHLTSHLNYHLGQVNYHRRLLDS